MDYTNYTVEDFVMDAYFQAWVQNPTEQTDIFWENWLLINPSKREILQEARVIIESMAFEQKPMPSAKADAIWQALQQAMTEVPRTEKKVLPTKKQPNRILSGYYLTRIAASITIISVFVAALYFYQYRVTNTVAYTTAYGETKEIILPDGSTVILNANSELTFSRDWAKDNVREVKLLGEAFFSVVHQSNHQKFIVHTDDFLQVEVLGTEFNVTKRKNKTRVVLETGKIKLNIQPPAQKDAQEQSLTMKPGELVEFDENTENYIRKEVNPELYSSWKTNKLLLDDTSLQEIIQLLENSYGFQVKVADNSLLKQKVSGSIPLGNTDTLLQHIAQTFEIRISRKGNVIQIYPLN